MERRHANYCNTSQIKDGNRYYQKPVRMKWGQTVVEGFTQFSPENPPRKSESTKKFVWWNPFTWFNW